MAFCKIIVLALAVTQVHVAEGSMMKALQKRSLAVTGLPDPYCKTGVISLKAEGKPKSCCAGYCGACNDYDTCKSINGQDSENACCASKVYDMRCGSAPANVCLKTCSEAVPPCIMDKDVDSMPIPQIKVHKGVPPCNDIVPFVAKVHAVAITKGETLADLHMSDSNLQQALGRATSTKAKLQTDSKGADIPKDIAKGYADAIKRADKVMQNVPKGISKVQKLRTTVTAVKYGEEISDKLELEVTSAMDDAEAERKEAQEVKEASQNLRQQVLDHAAGQLAGAADKQADQYADAQAAVAKKEEAAAKAKKEAAEAAAAAAKAKEEKQKAAAAEAAAKSKEAAAAAAKAKEAAAAEEEKQKAAAAKAKQEAAKLKADAEAAAAKAKKQEAQKKAAEVVAQKAAKKACQSQLEGLPCGQEWAFVTDSKNNLVAIKKGPQTGSGKTEVHRLTAASNYEKYDLQTRTALQITDKNWDFVMDSKDNLVAILKGPKTGSGKTEVHRLSASSNYLQFDMQTRTALQYTDENWAFTMDSKDNLLAILKGPVTGSGKTEVHRLSAASNYLQFDMQTRTGLAYSNAKDWDFAMDPQDNLVCILKGPSSGSGKTEVHKLSAASNYIDFNLHTATALHYTTEGWAFAMANDDVVAILKGPTSGSCMTEVHKLSGAANYGKFVFQTGTGLGLSAAASCAR